VADPHLTVYEKPSCTTCRKLSKLLTERGIDFEKVDYYVEPLSGEKLRELFRKAGIRPREALRTRENAYRQLGLIDGERTDDELIELMAEHPDLLQRPIVERGARAVLARPVERVLELLD
jgi:arsenate reductase (glutaredoxin)